MLIVLVFIFNYLSLRWGEVIPLYFIPGLNNTKAVIISQPSRRYTEDVSMIPELLKLGNLHSSV